MGLDPLSGDLIPRYFLTLMGDLWGNTKKKDNPEGLMYVPDKHAFVIP